MSPHKNYINGTWTDSSTGKVSVSTNPADVNEVVGEFQASDANDAARAVESASITSAVWSSMSPLARGGFLMAAAEYLGNHAERYAQAVTKECGKAIAEARGEVGRAVALLQYYGVEGSNPVGQVVPSVDPSILLYTRRVPIGVVTLITPWNFPLAIPIWKMAPAMVYGNTIVLKPASPTPLLGVMIAEMWESVDLPAGVFNLVTGSGGAVGDALVESEGVSAVSFTGSTSVGMNIASTAARRGVKYQLEMGGKNPVIVLPDADLEQAAQVTVDGAMKYSGQKCTATSRAIVVGDVIEDFTDLVVDKVNALKVGPGAEADSVVVPVIDDQSRENIVSAVARGVQDGANVLAGGDVPSADRYVNGHYIEPTVLSKVSPNDFVACEEIFGPVLGIIPAADADEAIDVANDVRYGLSAGIFTRNLNAALTFADRIQAGIVKVNGETAGVEPQVPFGGMKQSSSGSREQGKAAIEFFTETKTIYVNRSAS